MFIFMQQEDTVAVCHDTSNPNQADPTDLHILCFKPSQLFGSSS